MTDCPNGEVRDLLPDLLHDRLAPNVRQEVEAHVAGCAECRAELALLGALRSTLRRGPAVDVGAIAAAIPPYRAPMRRSWGGWRAAAAVLLVAGGTSVAVLQSRNDVAPAGDTALVVATRTADSSPVVASARQTEPTAAVQAAHELALGSSAATDLDDQELSTLLSDLQSLDALPSADAETALPVSPIQPKGIN